ncbi:MAG TPA: CHAP domain-containing protein [Candidatus Saccharimonadales bacterium]|nr:CHAP domain-containing protein [Candidatus Saccharimonadales bacterium]
MFAETIPQTIQETNPDPHTYSKLKQAVSRISLCMALSMSGAVVSEVVQAENHPAIAASVNDYPWADAEHVPQPPATDNITWGYKDKTTCDGKSAAYDCKSTYLSLMDGTKWYYRDQWGYDLRNCTSYIAWRSAAQFGKDVSGWGNAADWANKAKAAGYTVDTTPEAGDIAQWDATSSNSFGHVAFVESVNSNGTVNISQFNKALDGNGTSAANQTASHYIDLNGTGYGLNGEAISSTSAPKAEPDPQGPNDPYGHIDAVKRIPGGLRVEGWALDPDDPSKSIDVHVYTGQGYVDPNHFKGWFNANMRRDDLADRGTYHGFVYDFLTEDAETRLCLYGINIGAGSLNRRFDCNTPAISGTAIGNFERIFRVPGGARLIGWGLDPDTNQPIDLHFYESENADPNYFRGFATANQRRDDVEANLQAAYVGYGPNHGVDYNLPLGYGPHRVCGFALNKGGTPGGNQALDCRAIDISPEPYGVFEGAWREGGGVAVRGWAIDPDIAGPVDIHVYRTDGSGATYFAGGFSANQSRQDVVTSNPGYDEYHGFNTTLSVPSGYQRLCAYVLNAANTAGHNRAMGCITVG